jgi:hypothetical protein
MKAVPQSLTLCLWAHRPSRRASAEQNRRGGKEEKEEEEEGGGLGDTAAGNQAAQGP